jgi:hypothetical protein
MEGILMNELNNNIKDLIDNATMNAIINKEGKTMQDSISENKTIPKKNRAQRRAEEKAMKKRYKKIMNYIKHHPEAVKVELDEEAIKEVEAKEKLEEEKELIEAELANLGNAE